MRRLFLLLVVVGSFAAEQCAAQATVSTHYRVVPRLSTLHQTGGFAGIDVNYRVMGEYDFVRGSNTGGPKFANAELWGSLLGSGPVAAYVVDVDRIFNLKGLTGKPLPVFAPYDVYKFRGVADDGSSIDLVATTLGPWMYLRGWTQPPPGSADYFTHQLKALARSGPFADVTADGVVDAADFALMRKTNFTGGSDVSAGAGFAEWRQQFGERIPDLAAMDAVIDAALSGASLANSNVPEPACFGLVMSTAFLMFGVRRRSV